MTDLKDKYFTIDNKTYAVLSGPDDEGDYTVGWIQMINGVNRYCTSSFWRYSDIYPHLEKNEKNTKKD